MEKKLSELKLPKLRLSCRRKTLKNTQVMPLSLSPVLPRIQNATKSFKTSRIQSPDYSSISPKVVHLILKPLNSSFSMQNLAESPIRPMKKVDSIEDKELQSLIKGLSPPD
jgi:hypothetical protein